MELTYIVGEDRRDLVKDIHDFNIDFDKSDYKWVQARQYENSMRQVFVEVLNDDHTPFDLTGCNIVFEGLLPDNTSRIYDANDGVLLDPLKGQFRFDMPKQAFAIAGSYVQAFFRIMRAGDNVAMLEFDMTVLADKVISGLVPADYITPFEDLYTKLEDILKKAGDGLQASLINWTKQFSDEFNTVTSQLEIFKTNSQALLDEWRKKFSDAVEQWNDNYPSIVAAKDNLDEALKTLQEQIKDNKLVTVDMIAMSSLKNLQLTINMATFDINDMPRFKAYGYYNGAGIPQSKPIFGVPEIFELNLKMDIKYSGRIVVPNFQLLQLQKLLPDFDITSFSVQHSFNGNWIYLNSGLPTIGIECLNAEFE
ncbi:hypothetical protein IMAU80323_01999 [Lactiplantibacillus plantarum]|nr:hypothetical protein [Lactiplantibacillus plantarum]MCG0598734.1 hypothetical protein [Lactiplantibacillus plantarum]MCG0600607.1 hypothetical protein [Lactiplantibacillus plantarum]MCG0603649.1 hypothetical protein [Lactiplantibacillus plantarum]MCG0741168.1 hypothetical protein [Lactiplantibacillus plantarum]